jgi:hypothetical protein
MRAVAVAARRSASNVQSSAMTPRQPSVPKAMLKEWSADPAPGPAVLT